MTVGELGLRKPGGTAWACKAGFLYLEAARLDSALGSVDAVVIERGLSPRCRQGPTLSRRYLLLWWLPTVLEVEGTTRRRRKMWHMGLLGVIRCSFV